MFEGIATEDARVEDPHRLQRFVDAQAPVYVQVTAELARGQKQSHWMWFVFPQMQGLGRSAIARHYGIASQDEALAYRQHVLLGPRLLECTRLVLAVDSKTALQIFGTPDDLKFRSSMTLFERVAPQQPEFAAAIDKLYAGRRDEATMALLASG